MKLSVIIVNFNTKEILLKCLENLRTTTPEAQIIVVDNGSSDGSAEEVFQKFPGVNLIKSTNVGLAAGYNLGISKATGDYFLFLGTDAFPKPTTIDYLLKFMESDPRIGVVTCKLVLRDGTMDWDAHRGIPTPWVALTHFLNFDKLFPKSRLFNQYFQGYKDLSTAHEIDLCISHFMLVKRQVINDIGSMDEKFFVYGEDVDFCYRVKQKDWKIFYVPQVEAVHYKGASVGVRKETQDITTASNETRQQMAYSSTDAMKQFYNKHLSKKYISILPWFIFMLIDLKKLTRSITWNKQSSTNKVRS